MAKETGAGRKALDYVLAIPGFIAIGATIVGIAFGPYLSAWQTCGRQPVITYGFARTYETPGTRGYFPNPIAFYLFGDRYVCTSEEAEAAGFRPSLFVSPTPRSADNREPTPPLSPTPRVAASASPSLNEAVVSEITGTALIYRTAGRSTPSFPAGPGSRIAVGGELNAGDNSTVVILMPGGTSVRVTDGSAVELRQVAGGRPGVLDLTLVVHGAVRVTVASGTDVTVYAAGGDVQASGGAVFRTQDRGGHPPGTTLTVFSGSVTSRDIKGIRVWTAGTTADLKLE